MVQSFGEPLVRTDMTTDYSSGHICAGGDCGAELVLTEDAVRLEVVIPQQGEGNQVVYQPFVTQQGTYAYEPYHFHEQCWDEYAEAIAQEFEEYDARAVHDDHSFVVCKICYSGIRLHEPMGLVQRGCLQASQRSPNGEGSVSWYNASLEHVCISCLRLLNDEILDLWGERSISYAGECPACTYERIWRKGEVCHHPWPEEDEDE
jgi:hypothetical protein